MRSQSSFSNHLLGFFAVAGIALMFVAGTAGCTLPTASETEATELVRKNVTVQAIGPGSAHESARYVLEISGGTAGYSSSVTAPSIALEAVTVEGTLPEPSSSPADNELDPP